MTTTIRVAKALSTSMLVAGLVGLSGCATMQETAEDEASVAADEASETAGDPSAIRIGAAKRFTAKREGSGVVFRAVEGATRGYRVTCELKHRATRQIAIAVTQQQRSNRGSLAPPSSTENLGAQAPITRNLVDSQGRYIGVATSYTQQSSDNSLYVVASSWATRGVAVTANCTQRFEPDAVPTSYGGI